MPPVLLFDRPSVYLRPYSVSPASQIRDGIIKSGQPTAFSPPPPFSYPPPPCPVPHASHSSCLFIASPSLFPPLSLLSQPPARPFFSCFEGRTEMQGLILESQNHALKFRFLDPTLFPIRLMLGFLSLPRLFFALGFLSSTRSVHLTNRANEVGEMSSSAVRIGNEVISMSGWTIDGVIVLVNPLRSQSRRLRCRCRISAVHPLHLH